MNRQNVVRLKDFLITQMNHWIFIMVALTTLRFFNYENPKLLLWIGVGIIPFLLYAVRCKVNNFFLFYLIHLVALGTAIMLPMQDGVIKGLLVIFAILYVILSIYHRMHSADGVDVCIPPIFACGIGVAAFFLYRYQKGSEWDSYYIMAILIYLGLYFVIYFLEQYRYFLIYNKSSAANIPERAILRSGMMQVVFFAIMAVVIMLLLSNLQWMELLWSGVKAVFIAILRLLFSGFEPAPKESVDSGPQTQGEALPILEAGEAALFWKVLEYIAIFLVAVGFVVGIVVLLVKGFAYLRSHFGKMEAPGTKQTDDFMDIRESCTIEKATKSGRKLFAFLDNREKIRKIFKKKIAQEYRQKDGTKDIKFLNFFTAKECCETLKAEALLQAYEKARYSAEECTGEDVKLAKMTK